MMEFSARGCTMKYRNEKTEEVTEVCDDNLEIKWIDA
jgi:hypothetical protein